MTQETRVDPNTGLESKYVALEPGKAKFLRLTNWRTTKEPAKDANSKEFINFVADCLAEGETSSLLNVFVEPKEFKCGHIDFRKKANAIFEKLSPSAQVLVRVKIVNNEAKPKLYDVELA